MPLPQRARYSYADLIAWPENERYELYDGFLRALASPSVPHQEISGELFRQLANFLADKPCRVYAAPVDVRLFDSPGDTPEDVDTVVVPDLLVVCDRGKIDRRGIRGAPDLVIEILSESSRRYDRHTKLGLYESAGVREYWIADPERRTVEVFSLRDGGYGAPVVYMAPARLPVGILRGCTIELDRVFP